MTARLTAYTTASTGLALLSDERVAELLASPSGAGIGGTSSVLDIDGVRVFAKQIPLTELESRTRSTANLFGLPGFCQYGLGSPGGGVWRELATQVMTTNWVLGGEHDGFPLLYHWRVLPGAPGGLPEELSDVDKAVEFWGGSAAVRERIEGLRRSTASVVLFLEHLPHTLTGWLKTHQDPASLAMVEAGLLAGTSFLNSRGLLHFDAHFENILTDSSRLYFADFGLALSSRFELSAAESAFFAAHRTYDRAYVLTALVRRLLAARHGGEGLGERVRELAAGAEPVGLSAAAAAIVRQYAQVAGVMGRFYDELGESRTAVYPAAAVERALARAGVFARRAGLGNPGSTE